MIYLSNNDLLAFCDQETLDLLVEDMPTRLEVCEEMAIGEMKGYLAVRYDADACIDPLEKIAIVTMHLVSITLYHAHAMIMPDNVPTIRETKYNEAVNWLEKIADGFINPELPVKEEEPTTPLRYGNSADKQNQYF